MRQILISVLFFFPAISFGYETSYCMTEFSNFPLYNGTYELLGTSPYHWENENGMFLWTQSGAQGFISDTDLGYPAGYPNNDYAYNLGGGGDVILGDWSEVYGGSGHPIGLAVAGDCGGGGGDPDPLPSGFATSTGTIQSGDIPFLLGVILVLLMYFFIWHVYGKLFNIWPLS